MNSVSLIGRLVRDPELRYTPNGAGVVRFTLAVNRKLSKEKRAEADKNNQPTADFISCVAWGVLAETIERYVKRGNKFAVSGRVQTGSYEKDGRRVYTTDVVVENIDFIEDSNKNSSINDNEMEGFYPVDDADIPF